MLKFETLTEFNQNWATQPLEKIVVELTSVCCETHHHSDSYYFLVGDDDFISPETGQPVRSQIGTKTLIEKREGIVYENLYSWAKDNEDGLSAWVSPPSEGLFPGTKIIFHEITGRGREKFVLNRAILADIDTQKALDIANLFSAVSVNFKEEFIDPEKVRSRLFIIKKGMSVINLLNLFVDDPELVEQIKSGQDLAAREEILQKAGEYGAKMKAGVSSADLYNTMVSDGFIGRYDISCPTARDIFSEYIISHSPSFGEYKHIKNCGNCGVVIEKLMKKGDRCPSCRGEYLGC